jgi:hypothetical protein
MADGGGGTSGAGGGELAGAGPRTRAGLIGCWSKTCILRSASLESCSRQRRNRKFWGDDHGDDHGCLNERTVYATENSEGFEILLMSTKTKYRYQQEFTVVAERFWNLLDVTFF